MTVQINNHSRRSIGFVTKIVAYVLTEYQICGEHSAYDGDLRIEWRTEGDILIFTVTDL
jgi:hypothetical protein